MPYAQCYSYDLNELRKKASQSSIWEGFPDCSGKAVFIKPNLVTPPNRFDYQSCTHVNLVRIVAEMVLEGGADKVVIGECGFKNQWQKTMEFCSYQDLLSLSPKIEIIPLQDGPNFHKFSLVRLTKGEYLSLYGVKFSDYLLECDLVINIPKLKMHSMAFITGAIKNMMGTMAQKGSMHPKADPSILHKRLRDFYLLIQPRIKFCLMDGIIGAEYCEQYGVPVQSNLLISKTDCWKLDCMAASAMSVKPSEVPYLSLIKRFKMEEWPELIPLELRKPYERPLGWRKD